MLRPVLALLLVRLLVEVGFDLDPAVELGDLVLGPTLGLTEDMTEAAEPSLESPVLKLDLVEGGVDLASVPVLPSGPSKAKSVSPSPLVPVAFVQGYFHSNSTPFFPPMIVCLKVPMPSSSVIVSSLVYPPSVTVHGFVVIVLFRAMRALCLTPMSVVMADQFAGATGGSLSYS